MDAAPPAGQNTFSLRSMTNRTLEVRGVVATLSGMQECMGMRIKGTSRGTFAINDFMNVFIFDGRTYAETFMFGVVDANGVQYRSLSVTDTDIGLVIGCQSNAGAVCTHGVVQKSDDGQTTEVISDGSFNQITTDKHSPDTLFCLTTENTVKVFQHTGLSWRLRMVMYPYPGQDPPYKRIQVRSNSILLAGEQGIDEYQKDGKFLRRLDTGGIRNIYMCCADTEDNVLIADHAGTLYVLGADDSFTPLTTSSPLRRIHDATIFGNKLLVLCLREGADNQNHFVYELQ